MTGRDRAGSGAVLTLGVDVGTTNTKAALVAVEHDVRVLATAARPTPDDALTLLRVVGEVVREVLDRARHRTGSPIRPAAVGVASMAETGVPLGSDGVPLTPLLRWDGHRAARQAAALARTYGAAELFAATGVRPSAKVPLATLAWLRDEGVRPHRWAGVADLVVLAVTGELVTDHTLAGRTMAYRAVPDGPLPEAFDDALLHLVGLRGHHLPRVARPDDVAARVLGAHPERSGVLRTVLGLDGVLAPGTPVVVAGHDHAVGAWAAGARHPGDRADSLGTTEAVVTVLPGAPAPEPVRTAGMSWVRTLSGRHHALLAGSSSAGAMLTWLAGRLGDVPLEQALEEAAALVDGTDGGPPTGDLLVLPYLSGRQTPEPDPDARVVVLDGDRPLAPAEVAARAAAEPGRTALAVLTGVALQARWMRTVQAGLGGTAPDGPLTVLGAAARTVPVWAEVVRRLDPAPTRWVSEREPVAVGAALVAGVRSGALGGARTAVDDAVVLPAETYPGGGRAGRAAPADLDDALARFVAVARRRFRS